MVDEIGIERDGSLEFGEGGVVLALVSQDVSKLSVSLRQARVEAYSRLCQFKGVIECSGTEVIAIERFEINGEMSPGQHRSGACVIRVDRERLFEQTPCLMERRFGASVDM